MFHKFFYSEEKKRKEKKREEKKREDNNIIDPPHIDEFEDDDDDEDDFNINGIRIDYSSSRMIVLKNTIISSNNLSDTKYLIKKELGKGAFSNVYLAYAKNENETNFNMKKKYVLKTTKCKSDYAKHAVKEYQYYNKIDNKCKYIIYFKDFFCIPNDCGLNTPCLVLEYFHENFYNYMKTNFKKNYGLSIDILLIVTKAIVLGIDFLHRNEIIHCDLKPENIVINKKKCKIIDLGSAVKSSFNDKNCYMQSRYYRSPNCIVACDINPRIDYWSIGCIMYEALTMMPLFCRNHENEVLTKQLRFIDIPHYKINKYSSAARRLYDYEGKRWRKHIEKIYLFDYLKLIVKEKNIERFYYEEKWIFDTKTGFYSLINMCISKHYNEYENNYVRQLRIIEEMYKNELKFPSISTI